MVIASRVVVFFATVEAVVVVAAVVVVVVAVVGLMVTFSSGCVPLWQKVTTAGSGKVC